jgi:protein-tyrosine-phosphatase
VPGRTGPDSRPGWEDEGLLRQARRHAALGEPVRLAMVQRLLLTDASPGELGAAFGLATNVLAHHLKVLQTAGLVRRVRSEGDARRAYVQLCAEDPQVRSLLSSSGASPAAGLPAPGSRGSPARPGRVLFVCTQNSARSQLAAAAWQEVSPVPATSAGTHPAARVHPRTVATGRRHGLRIDPAGTTGLAEVAAAGDLIVCVCDNAHEELAAGTAAIGVPTAGSLHWAVPDPVPLDTDEAFEHAYAEIAGRVERLAHTLQPAPADQPA